VNPLANDRFAAGCGVELVESQPGHAVTRLAINDRHRNAVDLVHGGAIFTLAASAFFAACNAAGQVAVGINLSITYLRPATGGTLVAEATEVARSRRLAHCEVRVTDQEGRLVATLAGTASIKEQAFPSGADPRT
jgi:acyl-CoA thioesterase